MEGISSVPSGLETPDTIDLRKTRKDLSATGGEDELSGAKPLYTVLEQTSAKVGSATYLPSAQNKKKKKSKFDTYKDMGHHTSILYLKKKKGWPRRVEKEEKRK